MTVSEHPHRLKIIEAIRSHPDFGRGTGSIIDENFTDDELVDFFGLTNYVKGRKRQPLSVEEAVAEALGTHELWVGLVGEDN